MIRCDITSAYSRDGGIQAVRLQAHIRLSEAQVQALATGFLLNQVRLLSRSAVTPLQSMSACFSQSSQHAIPHNLPHPSLPIHLHTRPPIASTLQKSQPVALTYSSFPHQTSEHHKLLLQQPLRPRRAKRGRLPRRHRQNPHIARRLHSEEMVRQFPYSHRPLGQRHLLY